MAHVFKRQRWPLSIATAWVLTRNKKFVESCVRRHELKDLSIGPVKAEAYRWRWDTPIKGKQLGRRPVMLFPTVEAAAERLLGELTPTSEGLFERLEVLAHFPKLVDPPSPALLASVWRGSDPRSQERVTFSHAAWWIASERGTRIIVLDDHALWKPAFDGLSAAIVDGKVTILSVDSQAALQLRRELFRGILVNYPSEALRSPWRRGHDLFVDCDLLDSDQYFLRDQDRPTWLGLQVSSVDFLKTFDVRRAGAVGRPSSFSLIADELDRRIAALRPGEFLGRTADEVETSLSRWVADTHPTRPQCKAKTIRNRLREKILPRIARK
jgi:hypothetical protein